MTKRNRMRRGKRRMRMSKMRIRKMGIWLHAVPYRLTAARVFFWRRRVRRRRRRRSKMSIRWLPAVPFGLTAERVALWRRRRGRGGMKSKIWPPAVPYWLTAVRVAFWGGRGGVRGMMVKAARRTRRRRMSRRGSTWQRTSLGRIWLTGTAAPTAVRTWQVLALFWPSESWAVNRPFWQC